MDILKAVKDRTPEMPVIMITAYGSIEQAIDALKAGALDYVVKPFDVEELKIIVARGLEKRRLKEENILLKRDLKERTASSRWSARAGRCRRSTTSSRRWRRRIRPSSSPARAARERRWPPGPSISRAPAGTTSSYPSTAPPFPRTSSRASSSATPGARSPAPSPTRRGCSRRPSRGTLFLDEVGEMSPWTQVKLLRALQERTVRRVGGNDEIPVDVRIIAATNQDLKRRIQEGKFREELFYRLNVISFEMPPLRKRVEDIPILIAHFLQKYCEKMGKPMKRVTPEVFGLSRELLLAGEHPRARERHRAHRGHRGPGDDHGRLPSPGDRIPPSKEETQFLFQPGFNLSTYIDELTKKYINQALAATGGNLRQAAPLLGLSYRTIRYLVDKYELKQVRKTKSGTGTAAGIRA